MKQKNNKKPIKRNALRHAGRSRNYVRRSFSRKAITFTGAAGAGSKIPAENKSNFNSNVIPVNKSGTLKRDHLRLVPKASAPAVERESLTEKPAVEKPLNNSATGNGGDSAGGRRGGGGESGWNNPRTSGLIAAALLLVMLVTAVWSANANDNAGNESAELSSAQTGSLQLSKEYIYAGSRMLAIEDYGLSSTSSSNTASFVRTDTSTQGNWIGIYGGQGYKLAADGTSLPSWAQASFAGQLEHTWAASTSDTRALRKTANNGDRIASCWYTPGTSVGGNYSVSFNFTDGQEHHLAFYSLDWDGGGARSQQLQVLDGASNSVLDTRSVTNFSNGVYTVWKVKGQVTVKVTNQQASSNAVIGGFFIDDPNATVVPTPTPATPTPTPTATPTPTPTPTPAKPDLVISNFTVSPGSPTEGNAVDFSVTVTNQGAGTMSGFLGVKYQVDGSCPSGGCPSHAVGSITLAPNQSATLNGASATWTAVVGSHTLSAMVDDVGAVDESNESNNVATLNVNVNPAPTPTPIPSNYSPTGNLDAADGATASITGWSYDPDNPSASNQVHLYIDGPAGSGTFLASVNADQSRPDVNSAFGISGNHGFNFTIPSGYLDGNQHSVYAYGIDTGANNPAQLSNTPLYFQYPVPEPTPTPCQSNPSEIETCEMIFGRTWNYENCSCNW